MSRHIILHRVSGVYEIRNCASGTVYIGSGMDVGGRWYDHVRLMKQHRHYNVAIRRAVMKYGIECFEFRLLEPVLLVEDLVAREQHWLDAAKKHGRVYNICPKAGSTLGVPCSEEKRKKISVSLTGKKLSAEHRALLSRQRRGKKKTESHKANIGAARTGLKHTPETLAKMSAGIRAAWVRRKANGGGNLVH